MIIGLHKQKVTLKWQVHRQHVREHVHRQAVREHVHRQPVRELSRTEETTMPMPAPLKNRSRTWSLKSNQLKGMSG